MSVRFDTESIVNRVSNRLRSKEEWKEVLFESVNLNLIRSFSEELNYAMNYNEYLFYENRWNIAQNKSSLLSFSDIHRYNAHRKISATGLLRISTDQDEVTNPNWSSTYVYINEDKVAYAGKFYEINKTVWVSGDSYSSGDIVYYDVDTKFYQANTNTSTSIVPSSSDDFDAYTSDNKIPTSYAEFWDRIDVSPSKVIIIPAYTNFSGGDVNFVNVQTYQFTTDIDYLDIMVVQGILKTYNNTASGIINETFEIIDNSIENTNYKCYINGIEYSEIDSLFNAGNREKVFELIDKFNQTGINLKFGDDINGIKLTIGDILRFDYLESLGSDGNILGLDIINSVDDTINNVDDETVEIFCSNRSTLIGGDDFENLESIREQAPLTFQTGDRATSIDDYKAIILNNPEVTINKVNVWGVYETNIDNNEDIWTFVPTSDNLVYITALNSVYDNISSTDILTISEYINDKKAPTDILSFVDTEKVILKVISTVYVSNRSFLLNEVKQSVIDNLIDAYSIENVEYKQNLRFSDLYALIDNTEGVDYHSTSYKTIKKTSYTIDTVSSPQVIEINTSLPVLPIETSSVQVIYKDLLNPENDILMAIDDGVGGFTARNGFTIGSLDVIDYSLGNIALYIQDQSPSLIASPDDNHFIYIIYKDTNEDLLLSGRNDILDFDEDESEISIFYTT
jgi:hypothetical protein